MSHYDEVSARYVEAMMTLYIATVKDKQDGSVSVIKSEYKTKNAFRIDLHNNGYIILRNKIRTEKEYNDEV